MIFHFIKALCNSMKQGVMSLSEAVNLGVTAMCEAVVSLVLGVDVRGIKEIFEKNQSKDLEGKEIGDSIDEVSRKLEESKEILDGALKEMDKQKKLYEQMKKEAELSQQLSAMNEEQMIAVKTLLENTLNKQEKKAFPKNIAKDLFFCILSAIHGFLIGQYF